MLPKFFKPGLKRKKAYYLNLFRIKLTILKKNDNVLCIYTKQKMFQNNTINTKTWKGKMEVYYFKVLKTIRARYNIL